jgi:MOSC domain-containing protein YiiM
MSDVNPDSPLAALLNGPMRPGRVEWIGLRPAHREPMIAVASVVIDVDESVVGDRYRAKGSRTRQVTLIEAEGLAAIAAYLDLNLVTPEQMRRNIVVSGINLLALKGRRFRIGAAVLEMTGECHPCSRMEETLGPGGYNAVRAHGGITARVVESGEVRIGERVDRLIEDG